MLPQAHRFAGRVAYRHQWHQAGGAHMHQEAQACTYNEKPTMEMQTQLI